MSDAAPGCDCGGHGPDGAEGVPGPRAGASLSRRRALQAGVVVGGLGLGLGRLAPAGARLRVDDLAGAEPGEMLPGELEAALAAADEPVATAALAAVRVAPPAIVRRAEWGADEALGNHVRAFAPIQKLQVHHTATDVGIEPAQALRSIQRFHVVANGWSDIAYNFLIDPAGRIYEGRWARDYAAGEVHGGEDPLGRGVVGAHTAGYNTGGCGVALLGTYTDVTPTVATVSSLVHLLAWKAGPRGIDPTTSDVFTRFDGGSERFPNITGHRDLRATECPGDRMYALLADVRQRVRARIGIGIIGYRILATDGSIDHLGGALDRGSPGSLGLAVGPVAVAPGPDADGYWVLGRDGGIFAFGTAGFHGSVPGLGIRTRVVDLTPTATGRGYWVLGVDGGVFSFGDAQFHGSVPGAGVVATGLKLRRTPSGRGYWVLGSDGGIFCFGDAQFHGSVPGVGVTTRVADMAPTPTGEGYWVVGEDGGVFCFGDARFMGSVPGMGVPWARPARAIAASPTGQGYLVVSDTGIVYPFGDAPDFGSHAGSTRVVGLAPAVQG